MTRMPDSMRWPGPRGTWYPPCLSEKARHDLQGGSRPLAPAALPTDRASAVFVPPTFDGWDSLKVPDTDRSRSWRGRIRYRIDRAGYPTSWLMPLAETGTWP